MYLIRIGLTKICIKNGQCVSGRVLEVILTLVVGPNEVQLDLFSQMKVQIYEGSCTSQWTVLVDPEMTALRIKIMQPAFSDQ